MIPDLNEEGNLPPGIHTCTLEEIIDRFGRGMEERVVEAAELADFVGWARQIGIKRLLVDGSFVTAKAAELDVDVAILPGERSAEHLELILTKPEQWPFIHVEVASDEADLERWARIDFGVDRAGNPRGIVEIEL